MQTRSGSQAVDHIILQWLRTGSGPTLDFKISRMQSRLLPALSPNQDNMGTTCVVLEGGSGHVIRGPAFA